MKVAKPSVSFNCKRNVEFAVVHLVGSFPHNIRSIFDVTPQIRYFFSETTLLFYDVLFVRHRTVVWSKDIIPNLRSCVEDTSYITPRYVIVLRYVNNVVLFIEYFYTSQN